MRIIAHLDMDAFFASLEEAGSPIFKGLPIAVGSDPKGGLGRGVISTANYKAREYGIHSALPISEAWRLSQKAKAEGKPEVVFLPVDFERYNKASAQVLEIIRKHAKIMEPASIDEFYFDLSYSAPLGRDCALGWKKAEVICKKIKKEIKDKLKVTCSVGIGSNKLIAKIAAGTKKPDGLVIAEEGQEGKFLELMPIRELPGIGPKTEEKLNQQGIKIIKDVRKFSREDLYDLLGKWGLDLYLKARGIDDSPLEENREAKSIGEQATFQHDTLNFIYIGEVFDNLCKSVFKRFLQSGFKTFKTVGITVRFSDFETKTTAKTLKKETKNEKEFTIEALKLLLPYLDKRKNPHKKLIRLIGVKMSCLSADREKLNNQNILI
ncbi:MAG: DNA polymerase IV [Candidatus Staskawiczbacteria bacterium]|nr:DNA polymerase IV [Candidatus Staskawiczbacteria bacterium]